MSGVVTGMNSPAETPPDAPLIANTVLPCVLACSGCSRAGELADLTARRLTETGAAKMSCLAGVGGRVKSILATVHKAPEILMIDGCPLECGASTLRIAGISEFQHLKLHELGVRKLDNDVSPKIVERLTKSAAELLTSVPDDAAA